MTEFKPRMTKPEKDNKYYLRKAAGGVSQCIPGSPEAWTGSTLANCVGYAWGRVAELEENPKCTIGVPESRVAKSNYAPRSAAAWILSPNGREIGMTPKLGAVACWKHISKNTGHVAVVEKINEDGSWVSSESGYNAFVFANKTYNSHSYLANYKFQGFIYNVIDFDPEPQPEPPKPEELKVGDKVKIIAPGRATSYGEKPVAYGIGWTRYIKKIYKSRPYPYQVGNKLGTTGFYKADALEKI